jgi:hypothetical protein
MIINMTSYDHEYKHVRVIGVTRRTPPTEPPHCGVIPSLNPLMLTTLNI